MVRLSSTAELVQALSTAHDVTVLSYTLRPGPRARSPGVGRAPRRARTSPPRRSAVQRRARARSRDRTGASSRSSRAAAPTRAWPTWIPPPARQPVHAKALVADGRLFLDNRNFGSGDFILKDDRQADVASVLDAFAGNAHDDPHAAFAIEKGDALEREADLLRTARAGADVIVESETFGYGAVYSALDALGKAGAAPRLLVSNREARPRTRRTKGARTSGRRRRPRASLPRFRKVRTRRQPRMDRLRQRVTGVRPPVSHRLGVPHRRSRDRRDCPRSSRVALGDRPAAEITQTAYRFYGNAMTFWRCLGELGKSHAGVHLTPYMRSRFRSSATQREIWKKYCRIRRFCGRRVR